MGQQLRYKPDEGPLPPLPNIVNRTWGWLAHAHTHTATRRAPRPALRSETRPPHGW